MTDEIVRGAEAVANHAVTLADKIVYSAGGATIAGAAMKFLSDNQTAISILMLVITGTATTAAAIYGIYHKHKLREIAISQGLRHTREGD